MPITQAQYDFVAQTLGKAEADAFAQASGGVSTFSGPASAEFVRNLPQRAAVAVADLLRNPEQRRQLETALRQNRTTMDLLTRWVDRNQRQGIEGFGDTPIGDFLAVAESRPAPPSAPAGGGSVRQTQPGVPLGETAGTGDSGGSPQMTPSTDPATVIGGILDQWKAGQFGNDANKVVDAIAAGLNIDRNAALTEFDKVRGLFTGQPGGASAGSGGGGTSSGAAAPGVPTPSVTSVSSVPSAVPAVTPEPADIAAQNQALLGAQGFPDIARRVGQEVFPDTAGTFLGRRVLPQLQRQFESTLPITQFNTDVSGFSNDAEAQAAAFRQFLAGGRPTGAELGQQLQGILSGVDAGTIDRSRFEGSFTNPGAQTQFGTVAPAFGAAVTPFLQSISPFLRGGVGSVLEDRFRNDVARNPAAFLTAQQVFDSFAPFIDRSVR